MTPEAITMSSQKAPLQGKGVFCLDGSALLIDEGLKVEGSQVHKFPRSQVHGQLIVDERSVSRLPSPVSHLPSPTHRFTVSSFSTVK